MHRVGKHSKTKSEFGVATCEQQTVVVIAPGAQGPGENDLESGDVWENQNFTALPNPKAMEWH